MTIFLIISLLILVFAFLTWREVTKNNKDLSWRNVKESK